MDRVYKIAITGHRPQRLWGYDMSDYHYEILRNKIQAAVRDKIAYSGATSIELISGMALGVDTIFADLAIAMKMKGYPVKLIACIPFVGQERKWPARAQEYYRNLLSMADEIVVCSPGDYDAYKMQVRNEYMVNRCDELIAVWDGSSGGTGNCVEYAKSKKNITYINPASVC